MFDLERHLDLQHCPGCGAAAGPGYCLHCGEAPPRRLRARQALSDLYGQLVSLDFPLLRTLRELVLRPGATVLAYFAGRRRSLASPARFFFFWATVAVALTLLLRIPIASPGSNPALGPALASALQQLPRFVFGLQVYLGFVLAIPLALLAKRLWRRSGIGFAEAYAVLLYAAALTTLLRLLVAMSLHGAAGLELHNAWVLPMQAALQLCLFHWALGGRLLADCGRVLVLQLLHLLLAPLLALPLFFAAQAMGWLAI